jgi:MFS family permease
VAPCPGVPWAGRQPSPTGGTLAVMWRAVFVPTMVLAFAEGMLVPVLPLYVASLGVPFFWVGLVLAAEAIGMLLADVPAGALLRRIDRKTAMLLGIAVLGSAALALAWADGALQVFVLRLLAGLGEALWGISRHAYLTGAVPLRQRGRMIAAFGGATRVGLLAGPAVGGLIAVTGGFGATFVAYAVVAAVALVFCAVYLERAPVAASSRQADHAAGAWAAVWRGRVRALAAAGAGSLMAQAIRAGRKIVIPLYGATVLGLDVQQVGWIVSMAAAFDVSLFPVAGWVMDRFGRKWAIVPSFAIQALGMALVPLTGGFTALAAAASLIGLGNGLGSGTIMTLGADLAPPEAVGEFLGVWRLIGDGGSMGGPVLVGALADALSLPLATLAIALVGAGAALTFAVGVPETLRRSTPASP